MRKAIVLSVLVLSVVSLLVFFNQRKGLTQIPKVYELKIKDRYEVDKVILKSQPPEIPSSASKLTVKYERYKESQIAKWFGAKNYKYTNDWLEENKPENIENHNKRVKELSGDRYDKKWEKMHVDHIKDNKSFWLEGGETGGLFKLSKKDRYFVFHAPDPYINGYPPSKLTFSEEEAGRLARTWIANHGGFPKDAQLVWTRQMTEVPLSYEGADDEISEKEKAEVVGYYLHYRHKFNGRPIHGDEIKIKVTNDNLSKNFDGIDSYYRTWSEPVGFVGGEKGIIKPEEAIESMAKALAKESGTQSGTERILEIKSMNLIYYDPELGVGEIKEENIFHPAWGLEVENMNLYIVVDAYTGEVKSYR